MDTIILRQIIVENSVLIMITKLEVQLGRLWRKFIFRILSLLFGQSSRGHDVTRKLFRIAKQIQFDGLFFAVIVSLIYVPIENMV